MARPVRPTVWCALALLLAAPSAASAASFAVNSTLDAVDAATLDGVCATATGECTLRAAVQQANALPGADTITVTERWLTLAILGVEDAAAAGDLDVTGELTIAGARMDSRGRIVRTAISGSGGLVDGVFETAPGSSLTLRDLVVSRGWVTGDGAGIAADGALTLERVSVRDNRASADAVGPVASRGGGVFAGGGLRMIDSSVMGNRADAGAGLYVAAGTTATIERSTIDGNLGNVGAAAYADGRLSLTNSTVTGVVGGPTIAVGASGALSLNHVTLASADASIGNASSSAAVIANSILSSAAAVACVGAFSSLGGNLATGSGCGLDRPSDRPNTSPALETLGNYGGPTPTMRPGPGSPAIDAGANCGSLATDQRGGARPQGAACDSGAVETGSLADLSLRRGGALPAAVPDGPAFAPPPALTTPPGSPPPTVTERQFTVGNSGPDTASNVRLTFDVPVHAEIIAVSGSPGPCSVGPQTVCELGSLSAASAAGITVSATFRGRSTGSAPLVVTVTSSSTDPRPELSALTTGLSLSGPPIVAAPADTTRPRLSGVSLTRRRFRVGSRNTATDARARPFPRGTTFRAKVSEAGALWIEISRAAPGRRDGRRCAAPRRKLKGRRPCTRLVLIDSIVRATSGGAIRVPFSGRLDGRALAPGRYTAALWATDSAGNSSKTKRLRFTVLPG